MSVLFQTVINTGKRYSFRKSINTKLSHCKCILQRKFSGKYLLLYFAIRLFRGYDCRVINYFQCNFHTMKDFLKYIPD